MTQWDVQILLPLDLSLSFDEIVEWNRLVPLHPLDGLSECAFLHLFNVDVLESLG